MRYEELKLNTWYREDNDNLLRVMREEDDYKIVLSIWGNVGSMFHTLVKYNKPELVKSYPFRLANDEDLRKIILAVFPVRDK